MSDTALWQRLESQVAGMVNQFPGVAGVRVKDLRYGDGFAIRGDESFPCASTIKMHVLTRLLLRAELGEIDLGQVVQVTPDAHVSGSGIISSLEGSVDLSWLDLAILMIVASDNTAANLCIRMAGKDATNRMLRSLGLKRTVLRRSMMDLEAVARSEDNVSTPAECVTMLELLCDGKPTPGVAERTLDVLRKRKIYSLFDRAIPEAIAIANKPGRSERVCCDAGIVYLPQRPYAVAVMTKVALCGRLRQERFVVDVARTIHRSMCALVDTNDYGHGLSPQLP